MAKMFTTLPKKGSDKGIIRELGGLSEATRDALLKRDFSHAPAPRFNPDTASTEEWIARRLSGIRHNTFTGRVEFWVLGQIRKELLLAEAEDPHKFLTAHEEVFATAGTVMEAPVRFISYQEQLKMLAQEKRVQQVLRNMNKKSRGK